MCRRTSQLKGAELEGLRAARRQGCTIGYKGLPSVDGRILSEHYATALPTMAEVEAERHLEGHVSLFETTPETALWHHRAVQALRSLPLLQRLPGTLTIGVHSLDLSRARRLT